MTENRGELEEEPEERTESFPAAGAVFGTARAPVILVAGTNRAYRRCAYCYTLWDAGLEKGCVICQAYPPKKDKKVRVVHAAHQMCLTCWGVFRKARRHETFTQADWLHVQRARDLRLKLSGERILPPMNRDDEGDRTTA